MAPPRNGIRGRLVRRTWEHDPTRYAPPKHRRACAYDAFVPEPIRDLEVSLGGDVLASMTEADAAIRSLNNQADPALAPFARLLLRTESIASSKVEGLQIDARDLARAEARADLGRTPGTTAAEILANVDAMQLAVEEASAADAFHVDRIAAVHNALLRAAPNSSIAGRVRSVQNWIGGNDYNPCGAAFVPPPPEEVPALLVDLCRAVDEETLPPLVQAAVVHAQFETIHPFEDGNGRTGRALVQIVLRRRALSPWFVPPISVVLARHRDAYIEGLTAFRQGDVAGWIEHFSVAAARAAHLASRYLDEVRGLQERWRDQLRVGADPRSDAAAWALIDVLPAHPVLSVAVGVAATGRTKPAVGQAVLQLEEAGILVPLTTGARNRSWEAAHLLDLLTTLEAGDPPA